MEPDPGLQEQRSARAELYLRHSPAALRLAFLMTGDRALADDLVQDAFVRLFGRLSHLRNRDAFEAYLRQTVVNLCRMHFRRQRVERTYLRREQQGSGRRLTGRMWTSAKTSGRRCSGCPNDSGSPSFFITTKTCRSSRPPTC